LVLLDVVFERLSEVAKGSQVVTLKEGIGRGGEGDFLSSGMSHITKGRFKGRPYSELFADIRNSTEIDTTVVDAKELVNHGLVGPLREERGHRVVSSVEDKEERWDLGKAKVEKR
jgi:hypothetical protein